MSAESRPTSTAPSITAATPDVVGVRALGDSELALEFAGGLLGTFDVTPFLAYPAYAALQNPAYFKSVFVAYGTVCWPEGEDFAPETLVARMVQVAMAR
jgi:hypothetical protein